MNDLQALEQQIQQRLKSVEERDRTQQIQWQSKMAEIETRHARFDPLANELMATIIDSRMEKLASLFDNAELLERNEAGKHYRVCRFNHSARYPASVKLSLSVAHDTEIENFLLVYDLEILPIFFKFERHDQADFSLDDPNQEQIADWVDEKILAFVDTFERHDQAAFSLDDPNQEQIADWVDEKILAFVDTYLQLDQTDQYQQSSLVTDPVCGMRFRKSVASEETEHAGHTYCFCSHGCHEKFASDPQRYTPN